MSWGLLLAPPECERLVLYVVLFSGVANAGFYFVFYQYKYLAEENHEPAQEDKDFCP